MVHQKVPTRTFKVNFRSQISTDFFASGFLSTMFYLSIKFTFRLVSCNKIAFEKNDIMYLLAHTYSCVHLASYARGYGNAGCRVFKRGKQN